MFENQEKKAESKKQESRRRQRGVHGRGRLKLSVPEMPGYYCRWCNDVMNNLHDLTHSDDYDYVTRAEIGDDVGESGDGNTDLGSKVRVLVDKDDNGPIYSYLMKKKLEFHEEDKSLKEDDRRSKEQSLRRGNDQIENQYGELN